MYNSIKITKNISKVIEFLLITILVGYYWSPTTYAVLQSTTYEMPSYDFGSGGKNSNTSTTYSLFGNSGQVDGLALNSTSYTNQPGLSYLITTNVPTAPTVSNNTGQYYNKLNVTINTASNPSDTLYAIRVTGAGTQYVQSDDTLGSTPVWQTNGGTGWQSGGFNVIGLTPGVSYTFSVSAKQGTYTQSAYGPGTTVATVVPSFTFGLNRNSVNIGSLIPGNVITAANTVTATVSTNGTGGAVVSVYGTNNGLLSSSINYTISSANTDLGSASQGYGIQGTTTTQTSGGPMEILSPYNVSSNNVGAVTTTKQPVFDSTGAPVTSGQGTFQIMAKAGSSTKAASDYADTITVVASGTF